MKIRNGAILAVIIISVLSACAAPVTKQKNIDNALLALEEKKQKQLALQSYVDRYRRLNNVAFPLLVSGAELCNDMVGPGTGVKFANKFDFPDDYRDVVVEKYSMGEPLVVFDIAKGSPAEIAGLKIKDVLVKVNDVPVPVGEDASKELDDILKDQLQVGKTAAIHIIRKDKQLKVSIIPVERCDFPVHLSEDDSVNAFATGKEVIITTGMMRFANKDSELGIVVAHEVAHNAMEHISKSKRNYWLGTVVDLVAAAYGIDTQNAFGRMGVASYSQGFESEADYVGLYIYARSDRDYSDIANFWRRMGAEHPGSIRSNHAASHPATPQRFLALENAVDEVDQKKKNGLPLLPNIDEDNDDKEQVLNKDEFIDE